MKFSKVFLSKLHYYYHRRLCHSLVRSEIFSTSSKKHRPFLAKQAVQLIYKLSLSRLNKADFEQAKDFCLFHRVKQATYKTWEAMLLAAQRQLNMLDE